MSFEMRGSISFTTTKATTCTTSAMSPQIAMSTRLTLCFTADESGTMKPRSAPERL